MDILVDSSIGLWFDGRDLQSHLQWLFDLFRVTEIDFLRRHSIGPSGLGGQNEMRGFMHPAFHVPFGFNAISMPVPHLITKGPC